VSVGMAHLFSVGEKTGVRNVDNLCGVCLCFYLSKVVGN